jgi:hypothetical protein
LRVYKNIEKKMLTNIPIKPPEKDDSAIEFIRRDITIQFGEPLSVSRVTSFHDFLVVFPIISNKVIEVLFNCIPSDNYNIRFTIGLIAHLCKVEVCSKIVEKLLMVANHYELSYSDIERIWRSRIEATLPESISAKMNALRVSIKGGDIHSLPFIQKMSAVLDKVQREQCDRHIDHFRVLCDFDESMEMCHKMRDGLLLIKKGSFEFLEITFTRIQRFLYYVNHKDPSFRILFYKMWKKEGSFLVWFLGEVLHSDIIPIAMQLWLLSVCCLRFK